MKTKCLFLGMAVAAAIAAPAEAQVSRVAEGIRNVLTPALSGANTYKGYVTADYTQGFGTYRTNFASLTTSQGYKFTNWFYMGAGLGIDLLWSTADDTWGNDWQGSLPGWEKNNYTTAAVMIPVFSDFRFITGTQTSPSFFFKVRVGASFLCSDSYVKIHDGYLTQREYFFLQPSVGVRIPINTTNPRQAIDIGMHYRLMTSEYWSTWQYTAAINGLGLNVSFEW